MKSIITGFLFLCAIPCILFSQSPSHRYKNGDALPSLKLTDAFGDSVTSTQLKGRKLLIVFNRYVSCPLCNFRMHELLEHYDTLKQNGLVIVSVYESGKEALTEYTTKEEVPFRMIADPGQKLYKQFRIRKSWVRTAAAVFHHYSRKHSGGKKLFKARYKRDGNLNRIGADFLVDENGIIRVAYYGKYAGDHLPVEEIVKFAAGK